MNKSANQFIEITEQYEGVTVKATLHKVRSGYYDRATGQGEPAYFILQKDTLKVTYKDEILKREIDLTSIYLNNPRFLEIVEDFLVRLYSEKEGEIVA